MNDEHDIVEMLRDYGGASEAPICEMCLDAADEIKSLRRQIRDLRIEVENLRSEIWSREGY